MTPERLVSPQKYFIRAIEFAHSNLADSAYLLQEPVLLHQRNPIDMIAAYFWDEGYITATKEPMINPRTTLTIDSMVLDASFSQRINPKNQTIISEFTKQEDFENILRTGWPIYVVASGNYKESPLRYVRLFYPRGTSPKTALWELQKYAAFDTQRIQERQAKWQ